MAGQNIASAEAVLKDYYVGPITEQMNQKRFLLDQIEKDTNPLYVGGKKAVFPVHKGRNSGRTSIGDGGVFPAAGKQKYADATAYVRYNVGSIELSQGVIDASNSSEGSFIPLIKAETEGIGNDVGISVNRQCFGNGNGQLTSGPTTVLGVDKASKTTNLKFYDKNSLQNIQVGDIVDVLVASSGATTNGVVGAEVTARSVTNLEVTLDKSLSAELAADTYAVYTTGSRTVEMDGLRNITAKGRTLHGINSSSAGNEYWDGKSVDLAGAVAGESSFEQLFDLINAGGNGDVEVCLTTRGIRRKLADSYQSVKRFQNKEATEVHGGFNSIDVSGVAVIIDDSAPKGFAFAFSKSALKWLEQKRPGWFEQDGTGMFRQATAATGAGYSANWQAFWYWPAALVSVAPNRTGRLENCADDTVV